MTFDQSAFEFFGNQLRETGERALAHFGTRDADHHGVVRLDHHPGIDFGRAVGGAHVGTERKFEAECKPGPPRAASGAITKERRFN